MPLNKETKPNIIKSKERVISVASKSITNIKANIKSTTNIKANRQKQNQEKKRGKQNNCMNISNSCKH